jgi:hypothetical protein
MGQFEGENVFWGSDFFESWHKVGAVGMPLKPYPSAHFSSISTKGPIAIENATHSNLIKRYWVA